MADAPLFRPSSLDLSGCSTSVSGRLHALAYSRLTASSLSFIGSISIVIYIVLQHKLTSSEVHPLLFLGIADCLLSTAWVVGNAMFLHGKQEPCSVLAQVVWALEILTHLLTVMYALVTWMKVYELNMRTNSSREKRAEFNRRRSIIQKVVYIACWLLPGVLSLIRLTNETNTHDCLRCVTLWADDPTNSPQEDGTQGMTGIAPYATTVFIVVLVVSFISLLLFYGHVHIMIKHIIRGQGVLSRQQRAKESEIQKRALLYICVFFFCWLLTLVVTLWARIADRRLSVENTSEFVVLMGQAWTMPMQGFLNCLVYGWSRSNFRKPKNYETLPFLEEGINYGTTPATLRSSSL